MRIGAVAAGVLAAAPALAQTAPPAPVTVSGGATLVSDYRLRGLSQSGRDPAAQASVGVDTLAGFYGSVFASTVAGYVARGADAELDLVAGYRRTLGAATVEGGLTAYLYPGHRAGPTTVAEPFASASATYGPLTAKLGGAVAWRQRSLGLAGERRGGAYLYGDLSAGIPRTPVTATAHLGRSFAANALTFGRRVTDWSLGATWTRRALTLGATYVDTNLRAPLFPRAATRGPADVGGATLVGSVGLAF